MNATTDRIIPLIGDTESKSTVAMRQAITSAQVGDEQRGEDPTVTKLQLARQVSRIASRLTTRQMEVLRLLCEGLPNKLICRKLNIATGTVKVHVSSILRELGVATRLEAVLTAHRLGLVPLPYSETRARSLEHRIRYGIVSPRPRRLRSLPITIDKLL